MGAEMVGERHFRAGGPQVETGLVVGCGWGLDLALVPYPNPEPGQPGVAVDCLDLHHLKRMLVLSSAEKLKIGFNVLYDISFELQGNQIL